AVGDPFDLARNESWYSPGANRCSTTIAHWPFSSALVVATSSPLANTLTCAFGGARPANTEAPSGSIRTTSNFGLSAAVRVRSDGGECNADTALALLGRCSARGTVGALESHGNATSRCGPNIAVTGRTTLATRRPMTILRGMAATPRALQRYLRTRNGLIVNLGTLLIFIALGSATALLRRGAAEIAANPARGTIGSVR